MGTETILFHNKMCILLVLIYGFIDVVLYLVVLIPLMVTKDKAFGNIVNSNVIYNDNSIYTKEIKSPLLEIYKVTMDINHSVCILL